MTKVDQVAQTCKGYGTCIRRTAGESTPLSCTGCPHRDRSELDERLTPYHKSGERVEVVWAWGCEVWEGYGLRCDGERGRFYVGCSTGWRPTYVVLHRTDSTGGGSMGGKEIVSVRGLGKYRPV